MGDRQAIAASESAVAAGFKSMSGCARRCAAQASRYLLEGVIGCRGIDPNDRRSHLTICKLYEYLGEMARDIEREASCLADECSALADHYRHSHEAYVFRTGISNVGRRAAT